MSLRWICIIITFSNKCFNIVFCNQSEEKLITGISEIASHPLIGWLIKTKTKANFYIVNQALAETLALWPKSVPPPSPPSLPSQLYFFVFFLPFFLITFQRRTNYQRFSRRKALKARLIFVLCKFHIVVIYQSVVKGGGSCTPIFHFFFFFLQPISLVNNLREFRRLI